MAGESPHLDEGFSAAPGISPGVVSDGEYLLRELYAPQHTSDMSEEELTERAITVTELQRTGFSVNRLRHVGAECIKTLIEERLAIPRRGKSWKSLGVARLKARDIRGLRLERDDAGQVLVVVDTATVDRPWHASVYAKAAGATPSHCRELRALLLPLLKSGRMPVDQAYADTGAVPKWWLWGFVLRGCAWFRRWGRRRRTISGRRP